MSEEIIIGTIVGFPEEDDYAKDLYVVLVDVPGQNKNLYAFPKRSEIDEPRVGDVVKLTEVDPIWHSYYIYEKLKENDFIGIRSRGKHIRFKDDALTIAVHDPEVEWYDDNSGADPTPEPTDWIKIDADGNLDVYMRAGKTIKIDGDSSVEIGGSSTVKIGGDASVEISGNGTIKVSGNCDIKASGSCNIDSPDVNVTGASFTVNGTAAPSGSGPWCAIPACLFSGAPHVGNKSAGN